jgi:hypothetical protein
VKEREEVNMTDMTGRGAGPAARVHPGANRVYPGKDFGLIVDYNGMLKKSA